MVTSKSLKYGAFGAFISLGLHNKLNYDLLSNYKLVNFTILVIFIIVRFLKWLIFGKLSLVEINNLRIKFINFTIWEFLCGFTIFYFQNTSFQHIYHNFIKFFGLFFCILLLKCFHYISSDRVSNCFNTNNLGRYMMARFALGLIVINFIDCLLIYKYLTDANDNILHDIFGFEILHMFPLIFLTTLKFALNYYYADNWNNNKFKVIVIAEFVVNLIQFTLLCDFAMSFLYRYTVPLHILPSSYFSLRVLLQKARNLINFKKNQLILNKLEKPKQFDHNCIICFEDFSIDNDLRQLNCRHVFHYQCLNHWINYSNACPVCRECL